MKSKVDIVLGIETSCDETSVAVLERGEVKSNIVSSQLMHREFGGVVPELASRAHTKIILPLMNEALERAGKDLQETDGVAAVYGPGLVGALLVGLNFGKSLAWSLNKPFIGVNHMEGHVYSAFLNDSIPDYPFLCLIVSGGHTELLYVKEPLEYERMGGTRDDAAGEAFDKVAKMVGLGYPGGPEIDKLARDGDPQSISFPRAYLNADHYDFSFSGLKTSVLYYLRKRGLLATGGRPAVSYSELNDICASFQQAVVDTLAEKVEKGIIERKVKNCAVVGGVSANSRLREVLGKLAERTDVRIFFPRLEYCTDNAAMSAYAGWLRLQRGETSPHSLTAVPNLTIV